jgi:hypothetical protein
LPEASKAIEETLATSPLPVPKLPIVNSGFRLPSYFVTPPVVPVKMLLELSIAILCTLPKEKELKKVPLLSNCWVRFPKGESATKILPELLIAKPVIELLNCPFPVPELPNCD